MRELEELRKENRELKEQVAELKSRLTRPGRQKDDSRMMEKRETFAQLYNGGNNEAEICESMQISSRTFDRLKAYAKLNGMLGR